MRYIFFKEELDALCTDQESGSACSRLSGDVRHLTECIWERVNLTEMQVEEILCREFEYQIARIEREGRRLHPVWLYRHLRDRLRMKARRMLNDVDQSLSHP
ncbi:TPA: hypothetical protein DE059_04165 [Candidatus Peribacteria bacterium]|nr:hypothetical protein [Candidatus Peribacteria bacterium]